MTDREIVALEFIKLLYPHIDTSEKFYISGLICNAFLASDEFFYVSKLSTDKLKAYSNNIIDKEGKKERKDEGGNRHKDKLACKNVDRRFQRNQRSKNRKIDIVSDRAFDAFPIDKRLYVSRFLGNFKRNGARCTFLQFVFYDCKIE